MSDDVVEIYVDGRFYTRMSKELFDMYEADRTVKDALEQDAQAAFANAIRKIVKVPRPDAFQ